MSVIDFRVRPLYKHYIEGFDDTGINRFFDIFWLYNNQKDEE